MLDSCNLSAVDEDVNCQCYFMMLSDGVSILSLNLQLET